MLVGGGGSSHEVAEAGRPEFQLLIFLIAILIAFFGFNIIFYGHC
jgi:hypothetical protein